MALSSSSTSTNAHQPSRGAPRHDVLLALGSNLGDRRANLTAALRYLAPVVHLTAVSAMYETPPWGVRDQPNFLNLVARGTTVQTPHALLATLKEIESRLGRTSAIRWGPRLIDIDMLSYDDQRHADEQLTLPHPRLHERAFVLVPLAEIAPAWRHPVTGRSVQDMLSDVDRSGIRRVELSTGDRP